MDMVEMLQKLADSLEREGKLNFRLMIGADFPICGRFSCEQDAKNLIAISNIINEIIQAELAAQAHSQQKD